MLVGKGIKVKEYSLVSDDSKIYDLKNKIFLVLERENGSIALQTGIETYSGLQITSKDNSEVSKFPIKEKETGKTLFIRDEQIYMLTCDLEELKNSDKFEVTDLEFEIDVYEYAKQRVQLAVENNTIRKFNHLEDLVDVLTPYKKSTYELDL